MVSTGGLVDDARRFARRTVGSWQRRRATTPPAVDRTGFYAAGDPGRGRRGEVLATEALTGPPGATAWRVRYRTIDASGRAVAASMAVAAPAGLAPTPRPVAVWVHGAVGVCAGCGPSRQGLEAWYAERLLREGLVVVAPDLTGLGVEGVTHPYLHGTTAGRSVLDAVRAAGDLTATGAGGVVALAGHSAGGHAVLWANELAAADDGSDLDVRIVVAMAPIGDLSVAMTHHGSTDGMAVFPVQLAATWPDVEPVAAGDALTPAALARLDDLASMRLARLSRRFGGPSTRWVRADAFSAGAWAAALERQSAGRRPGAGPVLLVQGDDDDPVLAIWTRELATTMDAAGVDVELRTYAGADHLSIHDHAQEDVVSAVLAALRPG